ncbi:YphA family membrane protein, partial [Bacillus amyloliquefaciens]
WILATFIFAKTKSRFYVSVFILTNMMASIHQITAYFTLNAAYVMFFAAAFVYAGSLGMHKRLRNIVIHLTASAAYGFIFLFALYDPVWFIIKPEWAAVILLTVITLSVEGRFPERLCLFVLGMCQGELLYAAVIRNIAGAAAVGDYQWLSGCSAGVILLVGLTTYEQLAARISQKSKKQGKGATKMS